MISKNAVSLILQRKNYLDIMQLKQLSTVYGRTAIAGLVLVQSWIVTVEKINRIITSWSFLKKTEIFLVN